MSLILPSTKYINVTRTVTGTVDVENSDQVLDCDTTLAAVTVNLKMIPADYWSTMYRLFVKDYGNNAGTNNITIVPPAGFKVNGASSLVINTNGAAAVIQITSNTDYLCTIGASSGALTTLTVTDTATVDLTLTPIAGGYNLQANTILQDSFTAVKSLQQTNTSYCKRTNQYYLLQYTSLVGAFIVGETISSGGTTGVIATNNGGTITYASPVGVFIAGQTITGGTSGATAILTTAGKYENPFQSITNGSIFQNYTTKTETGAFAGNFDLTTGQVTIPSTGWYYIQSQIGWALNATNQYSFLSDNQNTLNQYWNTTMQGVTSQINNPPALVIGERYLVGTAPTGAWVGHDNEIAYTLDGVSWSYTVPGLNDTICIVSTNVLLKYNGSIWVEYTGSIGSFSLTNHLIGSGLASVDLKTITQTSSQLYLYSNVLIKLTLGSKLQVVYTNNTDLEFFGQPYSNVIFRGVKLSN